MHLLVLIIVFCPLVFVALRDRRENRSEARREHQRWLAALAGDSEADDDDLMFL
jgi:hypothetical protein